MPANTSRHGLPYPINSDPLADYDDILKSFAEAVDEKLDTRRHTSGLKYVKNIAYYEESAATLPGYIVLQTNLTMGNHMMRIDFRGYSYNISNNVIDLSVTGYDFQPDNQFYNCEANNRGTMAFQEIKWMVRNSDGKLALALLPYTGGSAYWNYPKLVADAYLGHTEVPAAQTQNWSLARVANLSAYTVKNTVANSFWRNMSLGAGWVNYGGSYTGARYCKVGSTVYLQGLIMNGTIGGICFTLPEGMRPSSGTLIFESNGNSGAHRTDINYLGQVVPQGPGTGYHSLSGIQFPAER